MKYEIQGSVLPSVDMWLKAGESVYTESGGMAWMKGDIEMDTSTRGGLLAGLGRKLAGESLFMTTYTCQSGNGMVTFTPEAPGRILVFELQAGQSLICQKDAFMAAQERRHAGDALPQAAGRRAFRRRGLYPAKGHRAGHGVSRDRRRCARV